jgi:uncharacterized protein YozE (UPF0346 family)
MWQLKPGLNILSYLFKLRNLLTKNDIQIVHAVQPLDALLVYFATLGTNIKKCVTFHSFDYHASFNEKIITKLVFAKTDIILFVSQFQQFYYQEKYRIDKEKVKVLNNGISFKKIDFAKVEKNYDLLSKYLNSSETAIKILSVGNFNVGRDQYSICRFAKVLKSKDIDFQIGFLPEKELKVKPGDMTNVSISAKKTIWKIMLFSWVPGMMYHCFYRRLIYLFMLLNTILLELL